MKKICVISSFAEDTIFYKELNTTKVEKGGPALFVCDALKDLGVEFELVTGDEVSRVDIVVASGTETGKIVSVSPIENDFIHKADLFIISTISDEYPLENIGELDGMIAIDMQGYVRKYKNTTEKLTLAQELAQKITIMKVTEDESKYISPGFLENQKNRILIITKGKKGFELYVQGKKFAAQAHQVQALDTIGAGDTFFTAFCVSYLENLDLNMASKFAQAYVEEFLIKKQHA